jgi:hypothetical protein
LWGIAKRFVLHEFSGSEPRGSTGCEQSMPKQGNAVAPATLIPVSAIPPACGRQKDRAAPRQMA